MDSANRRWPGILLSFVVPGFGLIRANHLLRGLVWWCLIVGLSLLMVASLLVDAVSIRVGYGLIFLLPILHVWMLADSFRPGRMSSRRWLVFILLAFLSLGLSEFVSRILQTSVISTYSMAPTLMGGEREGDASEEKRGDYISVNRLAYKLRSVRRGELIVFSSDGLPKPEDAVEGTQYVKRVIGLPGETIKISDQKVYIDQKPLDERFPPIPYEAKGPNALPNTQATLEFTVPDDHYYVLGDNTEISFDSRFFGAIPATNVIGRVCKIFYPFDRCGVPDFGVPGSGTELPVD